MAKPFDPEKPFTTKSGFPARLIGRVKAAQPLVVAVSSDSGGEEVETYTEAGRYFSGARDGGGLDLVNVPEDSTETQLANELRDLADYIDERRAEPEWTPDLSFTSRIRSIAAIARALGIKKDSSR